MRCYLDTNILVYALFDADELHTDTVAVMMDYENILLTSSVCVQELIHLCQIGKLTGKKQSISVGSLIGQIRDMNIGIVPVSEKHLETLTQLPMFDDHRDPNDRLIIAQAISDHIALISSDLKFDRYIPYGLDFIYNKR